MQITLMAKCVNNNPKPSIWIESDDDDDEDDNDGDDDDDNLSPVHWWNREVLHLQVLQTSVYGASTILG